VIAVACQRSTLYCSIFTDRLDASHVPKIIFVFQLGADQTSAILYPLEGSSNSGNASNICQQINILVYLWQDD